MYWYYKDKRLCIPSERNAVGRQFSGRWDLAQGKRPVWNLYIGTVLLTCVVIAPVVPISKYHLEQFGKRQQIISRKCKIENHRHGPD